jgi:hypothetical protein
MGSSISHTPVGFHGLLRGHIYFVICIPCAPQRPVTAIALLFICIGYSYLTGNIYMASTACNGDSSTLLYVKVFVPHTKRFYGPPRLVQGYFYLFICIGWLYLTGNTRPPRNITGTALLCLQLHYWEVVFEKRKAFPYILASTVFYFSCN